MDLFVAMLPLYIFGNLHCLGMCGPLVMMLSRHKHRFFYFWGRIVSFTLAGMIAGGTGSIAQGLWEGYSFSALLSLLLGTVLVGIGICSLMRWTFPLLGWLAGRFQGSQNALSLLLLRDHRLATFLFGFFTIALPCGQTIAVFSMCALARDPLVGLLNGLAFSVLTSPSLFFAMKAEKLLPGFKRYANSGMGVSALVVGILALCRGLAELELIPHGAIAPSFIEGLHLVLF